MGAPTVTSLTPPRLSSLPVMRAQLASSSRSIAFVEDGRRLLRAWGPPERPWVVGVEPAGARWRVEAWGAGPSEARSAVRALFSLDHPIEAFYALARREPGLRGTERRFRGLRLPRDASLYEALLHSIIGQQLSVASASAMKRRLFDRTEARVRAGAFDVPSVPPPSALVRLGLDGVRELGMSRVKSRSLLELARWAADRPAVPPGLAEAPLADAVDGLLQLYGVGRWTAENALLRGAGRTDVFVAGDLGIRVALERFGLLPRAAPETAARDWADRAYPGWGSYATLYLWRRLVVDAGRGSAD